MKKCPTCNHSLERLEDYPIILLRNFKKIEIPQDIIFQDHSWKLFAGPGNNECQTDKVPKDVSEFFKDNPSLEDYEKEDGTIWTLYTREEKRLNPHIKYKGEDWDIGTYRLAYKDRRNHILNIINPYLNKLESIVGKEVSSNDILPPAINETNYLLFFSEKDENKLGRADVIIAHDPAGESLDRIAAIASLEYEVKLNK